MNKIQLCDTYVRGFVTLIIQAVPENVGEIRILTIKTLSLATVRRTADPAARC